MFSGYDLGAIRGSGVDLTQAGAGRVTIKAADFVVTGINPAEFMHRQAHPNVPAGRTNTSSGGKVLAFKRKGLSIASGHARQRAAGVGLGECSVAYFFSSLRDHPRCERHPSVPVAASAAARARLTASNSAVIVMQQVCSVAGCGNEVGQ